MHDLVSSGWGALPLQRRQRVPVIHAVEMSSAYNRQSRQAEEQHREHVDRSTAVPGEVAREIPRTPPTSSLTPTWISRADSGHYAPFGTNATPNHNQAENCHQGVARSSLGNHTAEVFISHLPSSSSPMAVASVGSQSVTCASLSYVEPQSSLGM